MQKSALVTGGAVRLGRHISLHLAHSGWDIALHYHSSRERAEKTQNEVRLMGRRCELFCSDFTQEIDWEVFIQGVCQALPGLSLLVNSASVYEPALLRNTSLEMWDRHFFVNLRAPFFLIQAFAKQKDLQLSKERKASIINILDSKIAFAQYHYFAYLLSKKALAELSTLAAAELAPDIRVNAIAPGVVLPMESRQKEYLQWRVEGIPLKQKGAARHILLAMDYLLENEFVTGQILTVDGGEGLGFAGKNFASFSQENSE